MYARQEAGARFPRTVQRVSDKKLACATPPCFPFGTFMSARQAAGARFPKSVQRFSGKKRARAITPPDARASECPLLRVAPVGLAAREQRIVWGA